MTWDRLEDRLIEIFKTRAEKVVFVKGDPEPGVPDGRSGDRYRPRRRHRQSWPDDSESGGRQVMRGIAMGHSQARHIQMFAVTGALLATAVLGSGCQKLKARDNLNKGVNAFKAGQYRQRLRTSRPPSIWIPTFHSASVSGYGVHEPVHSGFRFAGQQQDARTPLWSSSRRCWRRASRPRTTSCSPRSPSPICTTR